MGQEHWTGTLDKYIGQGQLACILDRDITQGHWTGTLHLIERNVEYQQASKEKVGGIQHQRDDCRNHIQKGQQGDNVAVIVSTFPEHHQADP